MWGGITCQICYRILVDSSPFLMNRWLSIRFKLLSGVAIGLLLVIRESVPPLPTTGIFKVDLLPGYKICWTIVPDIHRFQGSRSRQNSNRGPLEYIKPRPSPSWPSSVVWFASPSEMTLRRVGRSLAFVSIPTEFGEETFLG